MLSSGNERAGDPTRERSTMCPNPQIVAKLVEATREVFETMVFRSLTTGVPIEGEALRPSSNVVGTVGFAGSQSGLVAFYSTMDAAKEIAGAMLGLDPSQVNGEVPDAIGEITNMIAGSFRTKMAAEGDAWAISVPTVTLGSDFYIKPMVTGQRVLVPFRMGDAEVFVELILMRRPR
jgi:chemotaxis protein CheX